MPDNEDILLAELLRKLHSGDIAICDDCEGYALAKHMHKYTSSMGYDGQLCLECDLPEKWSSKWSKERKRRYYVYFDPNEPRTRILKWGHPTKGNPLYVEGDRGEVIDCKRKRE
ncbi:MAG: hypothetical protein CL608_30055 [Anaerolineaceae bacterium]|nr:hypothetical protein [Anaerolineaceae bacterium]